MTSHCVIAVGLICEMSAGDPTVSGQVSACGLEMISLFALLYVLKTLLHFDVFEQRLQQVAQREHRSEKHTLKEQEVKQKEVVKEDGGGEEDEEYNEDTVEKSYSVSSWSWPGSGNSDCVSDSDDDNDVVEHEEKEEEKEEDITNVTGDSPGEKEELIDEIQADRGGSDPPQISEDQDESRDEIVDSDSDLMSDCESLYSTDWYCDYTDHYKQIREQKSTSCTAKEAER